jgi:energy-coupling factor transporter ATP-binding protein EcfA2
MIQQIKLKFGSSKGSEPLIIKISPMTIFVGPNNSGKSKILSEIEKAARTGNTHNTNVIIDSLSFHQINDIDKEVFELINSIQPDNAGNITIKKNNTHYGVTENSLRATLSNPGTDINNFCNLYLDGKTLKMNALGSTMLHEQQAGDLQQKPIGNFSILFRDSKKRKELRRIIFDAFKRYIVIDPTKMGTFRLRLSDIEPIDDLQECGIHEDAVNFHKNAELINDLSDGIKSFTGIAIGLIAGEPKITLIDEPEAFLHPSLATNLGKEVGSIVNGTDKKIFASTHSSNFLMGCIQSGVPMNIIRLTYLQKVPTARLLPSDKVLKLMRHPLLRSTGVLDGLFYENVVVTEADADRAFYQEINERLLAFDKKRGINNCLFLNAQNKQTIHEIMKPLREMGIPCIAIVDVDIVKDGGTSWANFLNGGFVPEVTKQALSTSRGIIKSKFDSADKNFKINGGLSVLEKIDQESCTDLFDQLDRYGLFTVRNGELESWLKELNIQSKHSPKWLIEVFEKIGEDPNSKDYVKPTTGDVWDFIGKINSWFTNPLRKGIPE